MYRNAMRSERTSQRNKTFGNELRVLNTDLETPLDEQIDNMRIELARLTYEIEKLSKGSHIRAELALRRTSVQAQLGKLVKLARDEDDKKIDAVIKEKGWPSPSAGLAFQTLMHFRDAVSDIIGGAAAKKLYLEALARAQGRQSRHVNVAPGGRRRGALATLGTTGGSH